MRPTNKPPKKHLAPIIILVLFSSMFAVPSYSLQLTTTSEYTTYVQNYINSETLGNSTVIQKPIFPVIINNSQIPIGQDWTITCPLQAGHNYHVYCYGAWVNASSQAKTDYDIYIYDPSGSLVSSHTAAAGFPENLGNTVDDALFTPKMSGNYSFVIKNDLRESKGAQAATFMIIENLESDKWYTHFVEGKDEKTSQAKYRTVWSYEFVTNASKLGVYVKVPATLDMYEVRLYLMNTPSSPTINSFPLPWEPGLIGNLSGVVGGYNFENDGYRGVAYASCEHMGQDMFLNYSTTVKGAKLYHLVFIGEEGSGEVEFMIKTRFGDSPLKPLTAPVRAYPDIPTKVVYASQNGTLERAELSYSINNWVVTSVLDMSVSNQTCNATIPGQKAGSVVQYQIEAYDTLKNRLIASGSYTVKEQATLTISVEKEMIFLGENITVTGMLTPIKNDSIVSVQVFSANTTQTLNCNVSKNGEFTASFQPDSSGLWSITAFMLETSTMFRCDSEQLSVLVEEPPFHVKYQLYIIAGLVAALAVGCVVYFLKFREK